MYSINYFSKEGNTEEKIQFNVNQNENENKNATGEATYEGVFVLIYVEFEFSESTRRPPTQKNISAPTSHTN